MAPTRKVTQIPGVYAFEGKSYGPFEAANDKEFTEVPADFADALGLPVHESEAGAAAQDAPAEDGDLAAQVESLQAVRRDLEARLKDALDENGRLRAQLAGQDESASAGTPLPDDFPAHALLTEHGFGTVEAVRAGLLKMDGAEKSPVENISGIGKKSLEAIAAALE